MGFGGWQDVLLRGDVQHQRHLHADVGVRRLLRDHILLLRGLDAREHVLLFLLVLAADLEKHGERAEDTFWHYI